MIPEFIVLRGRITIIEAAIGIMQYDEANPGGGWKSAKHAVIEAASHLNVCLTEDEILDLVKEVDQHRNRS